MGLSERQRFFFDTSFFHLVYNLGDKRATNIYFDINATKYPSNYVLKELYRLLLKLGFSQGDIARVLDEVKRKCIILQVNHEKAKDIEISDRSDAPIVAGAKSADAVLVTADWKLASEASKHVKTLFLKAGGKSLRASR